MKKAVFFDIDGTLWNEQMQIPQSTKEAILRLREKGSYAFLCSGRSQTNIRDKALLELGFDGVVAACGTHIVFHGETIFEKLFSQAELAKALAVIHRNHMMAILEGPRYLYMDAEDFKNDTYVEYLRRELGEDIKPLTGRSTFEVNKLSINLNGADAAAITEELGPDFSVIAHNDWLVEVLPKGYSKATGIESVCSRLGILKTDTYAFGDSANDLEMLSYVAHGIAMGNGCVQAKEAAEFVTADIMEDGIWVGLSHYGLI